MADIAAEHTHDLVSPVDVQHSSQSSAQPVNEGDLWVSLCLKPAGWDLNLFPRGSPGTARTHALGDYRVGG